MSSSYDAWLQRVAAAKAELRVAGKTTRPPRVSVSRPQGIPAAAKQLSGAGVSGTPAPPERPRVVLPERTLAGAATMSVKTMKRQAKAERRAAAAAAAHGNELPKNNQPAAALLVEEKITEPRPKVRGDCEGGDRPCPWVGCRHHTYLDVTDKGSLKINHPEKEPDEIEASCSLDIADEGPHELARVGQVLNVSRQRVMQIEDNAARRAAQIFDVPDEKKRFVKQCKARDSVTGLFCRLLEHGADVQHHSERGAFRIVAAADQKVFDNDERIITVATGRNGSQIGGGQ